ncbi:UNVERIFIED_CONTAM: hypothetical protein GTU68_035780 [Idotea baltica]|nr:hypothetical protein [Idotea baltica]
MEAMIFLFTKVDLSMRFVKTTKLSMTQKVEKKD